MEDILRLLQRLDRLLLSTLKAVSITCFFLLTILITANVFVRFFPVVSLHWFDEIIELLYAYLVFYGAAALWITREHLCVGDWISGRLFTGAAAPARLPARPGAPGPGVRRHLFCVCKPADRAFPGGDQRLRHPQEGPVLVHGGLRGHHGPLLHSQLRDRDPELAPPRGGPTTVGGS